MLVYEGDKLKLYKKDHLKIQTNWNRRDFTFRVEQYLQGVTEKVLAISGLRGTGKTVGLLQAAEKYDCVYILAQKEGKKTGENYINFLENSSKKIVIIDEYTWIKEIKRLDYYLITAIQNGKRVVITGTESITLDCLNYGALIHRVEIIHTTMFPYDEYKRVYGLANSQKVYDSYLIEGGLFKDYSLKDYDTLKEYIENAIVDNLSAYLKNELTREKARTLTYAVLFKAICPSNLSTVPVLRDSNIMLGNFLETMGINVNIKIETRDLQRVADIFEKTGIIKRIQNFDPNGIVKEQYYITNPSITSQLIKYTYNLSSLDNSILGHIFESCAMIQLSNNKILEHEIYFLNNEGQSNIYKKELNIIIIDKEREHAYLFECKHSQSNKIKSNSTILSRFIELNYFEYTDIDGRYIIYNGPKCVKEYLVGQIIFTPLDSTIDNYFEFKKHIQDIEHIAEGQSRQADDYSSRKNQPVSSLIKDKINTLNNEVKNFKNIVHKYK